MKRKATEGPTSKKSKPNPRDFTEFTISDSNFRKVGKQDYRFHLNDEILSKDFNGWHFRKFRKNSTVTILDAEGKSLFDDFWITDRERLSKELWSNSNNPKEPIRILSRPCKLSPPTFEKQGFYLVFFGASQIQWRWKGDKKWKTLESSLLFAEREEGVLQIQKTEHDILSDIIEVSVPWKQEFWLPSYLSSIIVDQIPLSKKGIDKLLITQESEEHTCCDGDNVEVKPGIPFDISAVHNWNNKEIIRNYGTHIIPLPYANFNSSNYEKLEEINATVIDGLRTENDNNMWKLNLNPNGYFEFSINTWIIQEARSVVGTFNILEISSNGHVVIELNVFPASFYGVHLFDLTTNINLQLEAPFPLRNLDLLKQILHWIPMAEKRKVRSICKLWAKEISLFPAVFHLRLQDEEAGGVSSCTLTEISKLIYINTSKA